MHKEAEGAIIKVGDGRGFVIEHADSRLVLTAAHCLPEMLVPHPAALAEERTYKNLLTDLQGTGPYAWAECIFADPIADVAVLAAPDPEAPENAADAYNHLVNSGDALRIGNIFQNTRGWLLSLQEEWIHFSISCLRGSVGSRAIWLTNDPERIVGGMSGSPIISSDGLVIGLLSCGGGPLAGPNPAFADALPYWMVRGVQDQ